MSNLNTFIIIMPFILSMFSAILFLLLQIFLKNKYFTNLIISLILILVLNLFIIYRLNYNLDENKIFYLIFVYLCNSFIFMNLIQASVSSIQLVLLKIIYLNPGISRKDILKKYNSNHLFEQRLKRLKSGNIIGVKKNSYFLKNNKILLVLNFSLILKKYLKETFKLNYFLKFILAILQRDILGLIPVMSIIFFS